MIRFNWNTYHLRDDICIIKRWSRIHLKNKSQKHIHPHIFSRLYVERTSITKRSEYWPPNHIQFISLFHIYRGRKGCTPPFLRNVPQWFLPLNIALMKDHHSKSKCCWNILSRVWRLDPSIHALSNFSILLYFPSSLSSTSKILLCNSPTGSGQLELLCGICIMRKS